MRSHLTYLYFRDQILARFQTSWCLDGGFWGPYIDGNGQQYVEEIKGIESVEKKALEKSLRSAALGTKHYDMVNLP